MRKIVQILLFVISYAPLYFILLFQNINDKIFDVETGCFIGLKEMLKINKTSFVFLILIVISISLYFIVLKIVIKGSAEKFNIKEVKSNNVEHLSYLATYILPFAGLKFDSWQSVMATILLFYVLGHIYIKTHMILTNPTLTFFRYSISTVVDINDRTKIIIHKGKIKKSDELEVVPLVNDIFIKKNE